MKISTLSLIFYYLLISIAWAQVPGYDYLFPKPNAENVSAHSNILIRCDDTLIPDITNPSGFITLKSDGITIPGQTIRASDDRTLIFQPDQALRAGALVHVLLEPHVKHEAIPRYDYTFTVAELESNERVFEDEPLLQKSESDLHTDSYPRILPNGVSVPSDFPHIKVTTHKESADGYLFLHNIRNRSPYNIIFDNDGSPVWYERWSTGELRRDFTVQENGIITMTSIKNGRKYVGYDEDFNFIGEFRPMDGFYHDGHELQVLENGNYLIIGRRNIRIDASQYVTGGHPNATVEETTVQEFTPDHQLIFNWPALDYLADGVPYLEIDDPRKKFFRFPHFNAIDVDEDDGNLLISSRMLSEVTKVDRETGEIMWRLGGHHSDFRFVNDPFNGFSAQHDIRSLGNNLYSVFDNGNYHISPTSRGVVYKLDEQAKTATMVWQYLMPPSTTFSTYMGSMQHLPNGNFLINWAVGELPKASEVTLDGELVYEMNFVGNFDTYRTFRHPWNGVVDKPRLFVEQDDVSVILIFNKFGDKDVSHYNIYAGFEPNPTTLLDTSRTTLKRFSDLVDKRQYYFRVTAVYENGAESEFSNERHVFVNYLKPGVNIIQNGDFTFDDEHWAFTVDDADAIMDAYDGEMHIFVNDPGEEFDCVQLKQENIALMQGRTYRLEFEASASENRVIEAFIEQPIYPWNNYSQNNPIALRRGTQYYSYDFTMNDPSEYSARLVFNCGAVPGDVTIDNVSLTILDNSSLLEDLPQPWESADIGDPRHDGVAGIKTGKFVVIGSGKDIYGTSDEFHFAFREMEGDVEFIARLSAIGNTHDWAKAGLMIRETLHDGSANAMIGATAENGLIFQHRSIENKPTSNDFAPEDDVPVWLKMTKEGDLLSGYYSENGRHWTLMGNQTIRMDDVFYVGLAVTSHNDDALCSSYFDGIEVKTLTGSVDKNESLPRDFELRPAFPNPFNPVTRIFYTLPEESRIELNIYNVRGELVQQVVNDTMTAGTHKIEVEASALTSGVYLYKMKATGRSGSTYSAVEKMTVVK